MRSSVQRTALVSGAGWGIGQAICLKLLEEGYRVIGTTHSSTCDIRHERFNETKLDLSNTQSIEAAISHIRLGFTEERSGIDLLVNAAGTGCNDPDCQPARERLEQIFAVNVTGTLVFTEAVLPLLKPGGLIVNISLVLRPGNPGYRLAESALKSHSELLSRRLQSRRIAVTMLQLSREQADAGIVPSFGTPEGRHPARKYRETTPGRAIPPPDTVC